LAIKGLAGIDVEQDTQAEPGLGERKEEPGGAEVSGNKREGERELAKKKTRFP